ncbi:VUT family protein [Nonomuraea turkmeniaca]|uniref:VUT family protein n=2 Tax=Nonomuraea turkmeniaca TaxID=103838 RepID=A0A5S4F9W1_9ACTN|nr:VUT family protein [Nonomuraea turkmeniaca]
MVAVGFALTATAGTYVAGLTLLLRDVLQDVLGRRAAVWAVLAGAGLSALLASWSLALASAVAFVVSELADMGVYTPLRRRGWTLAVVVSGLAGAAIDSVLFLYLAGFPVWPSLPGQLIGKAWLTVVPALIVAAVLAWRRAGRVIAGDA